MYNNGLWSLASSWGEKQRVQWRSMFKLTSKSFWLIMCSWRCAAPRWVATAGIATIPMPSAFSLFNAEPMNSKMCPDVSARIKGGTLRLANTSLWLCCSRNNVWVYLLWRWNKWSTRRFHQMKLTAHANQNRTWWPPPNFPSSRVARIELPWKMKYVMKLKEITENSMKYVETPSSILEKHSAQFFQSRFCKTSHKF